MLQCTIARPSPCLSRVRVRVRVVLSDQRFFVTLRQTLVTCQLDLGDLGDLGNGKGNGNGNGKGVEHMTKLIYRGLSRNRAKFEVDPFWTLDIVNCRGRITDPLEEVLGVFADSADENGLMVTRA